MKKLLLLLLLLPTLLFAQDSWVRFQVQFDFYAPQESNFFMVSNGSGDTSIFFQPTNQYEYLDTVLDINSGNYTISLRDSYGDGWVSTQPASFKMGNACQGDIIDWSPVIGSFFQRDTTVTIYPCPPPSPPQLVSAKVIINLDQYPSETSWEILDSNGVLHASGSGYGTQPIYSTVEEEVWIPKGPLFFKIKDAYGDGVQGSLWQGNDGSYFVKQCNDTLVYGNNPAFGFDTIHSFASDSCPPIFGCTDNDYVEYNFWANADDGSCQTFKIFGCTDTTMYNYDPLANTMDLIDTCVFTLVLHDLMGNGWVGSTLRLLHPDTSYNFTHSGSFTDIHYVGLTAPDPIAFVFEIDPLAQFTTIECGFTLINPEGDTLISIMPPFITPSLIYPLITNCGNECVEIVYGCLDTVAINYNDTANTSDSSCYYVLGCTSPTYVEYNALADYDDGSCDVPVVLGCMDSNAFNYNSLANTELTGSCIAIVAGCMQPLAFNYNPNANTPDTCIAVVYGCMSDIALNYDLLANTDDGSCIGIIEGCMDADAFNYNSLANVDDGGCIDVVYGCTDVTMFNYDILANIDNGNCIPFVYGCTDSIMFNYNPLANSDNSSCIPFIFGCTDPSMLNYSSSANTEDFSCIAYIYGCMDSAALNYNPLANTDNNSCVEIIVGCMDPNAYNYESIANVNDSISCLYDANCFTGPGNPYWLNDLCYAWVISVDDYCCENGWDDICQATYDYCDGTWSGPLLTRVQTKKELIMITDLLGRPTKQSKNQLLFYLYNDGTVEKKLIKQ